MPGRVIAVNKAPNRGMPKENVGVGYLREGWGLEGDGHAGPGSRQVSILPIEAMGLVPQEMRGSVVSDAYTENITIAGVPLERLGVGVRLRLGEAEVLIRHIGKEVPKESGRPYIVSRQGRFGEVTKGGMVRVGDEVTPVD